MAKSLRIGVAGLTHDHVWTNLPDVAAAKNGKLVAVADPNHPAGSRCATVWVCDL